MTTLQLILNVYFKRMKPHKNNVRESRPLFLFFLITLEQVEDKLKMTLD